jgi:hypothetical protein
MSHDLSFDKENHEITFTTPGGHEGTIDVDEKALEFSAPDDPPDDPPSGSEDDEDGEGGDFEGSEEGGDGSGDESQGSDPWEGFWE